MILKLFLPLLLIFFNFLLSLLLGLLEPPVLPLPGLAHLLRRALLSAQQLLNTLGLGSHPQNNKTSFNSRSPCE